MPEEVDLIRLEENSVSHACRACSAYGRVLLPQEQEVRGFSSSPVIRPSDHLTCRPPLPALENADNSLIIIRACRYPILASLPSVRSQVLSHML